MSKHTPGPWFITGRMTKYVEARIGEGLIQEIAGVVPTAADCGYGETQEANASLIAAAPDLLEALENSTSDLFYQIEMRHGAEAASKYPSIIEARSAIAKARGEA